MYLLSPTVCLEVVNNFATAADPAVTNAFFQQYFLSILQDIFFVLTDADHKSGFKLQSALLARLFQLVELNVIAQPLYDPPTAASSNSHFLKEYTANLLKTAFPHVSRFVDFSNSFPFSINVQPQLLVSKSKSSLRLSRNTTMTSIDSNSP